MSCVIIVLFINISYIYFVNLSVIIVIISYSWDSSNSLIKFIIIYSYSLLGVSGNYIFL